MYKSGLLGTTDEEIKDRAKANAQYAKDSNGIVIFESELPKFFEKYPEIDAADLTDYVTFTELLKVSDKKEKVEGESESRTRLNTAEAAIERGVSEDKVAEYISEVEQIYVLCKSLNAKMTVARASFAMPRKPIKETEPEAVTQNEAQPQ